MRANNCFAESGYNETAVLSAVMMGKQKAFEDLFFRHKDRVYTIALTYTERHFVAEEIVQDVFVRVWKSRSKLMEIENFPAWIHSITRKRSFTALQKIAREGKRRDKCHTYRTGEWFGYVT